MNREKIVRLTEKYGGQWAVQHAQRLIRLVTIIADGVEYNEDAIWIAAHLHDWGAYPRWARGVFNHSQKSRELAEQFLRRENCPAELTTIVLETIEFHHGGAEGRSLEAMLLADADALEGLGLIGLLRECAMLPTEIEGIYSTPRAFGLRDACERVKIRMANNPVVLKFPKSREVAAQRVREMDELFAALQEETFGCL